jgi:hypothetical protein
VRVGTFKVSDCHPLLRVVSDHDTNVVNHQPGNSIFTDLYGYTTTAGHGQAAVHLYAINGNGRSTPLKYIDIRRLQVKKLGSATTTGQHLYLQGESTSVTATSANITGLGLEGQADTKV